MINDFEVFRRVVLMMLQLPDERENERLRIFVFNRPGDFRRINPNEGASGFFFHLVYGPRMVVGPQSAEATQRTLFHEYVHHLMNEKFVINYPRWYFEGMAELLDTTEIGTSSIVVGSAPPIYRWNPAELLDVIQNRELEEPSYFYQTAWAMVHNFLINSYQDPTRARQTVEYILRYDAGEDPVEAFLDSYDTTLEEMSDELEAYGQRPSYVALTLPPMTYEGEVRTRELDEGEDLYILGDLALELEEREAAFHYFEEFADEAIDSPLAWKVKSRTSIALAHEGRYEEGDQLIDELVMLNIGDADVVADIAHYAIDRYDYAVEDDEVDARLHLDRSLRFGRQATDLNPADLEALYYLGRAYERDNDIQSAVDTLLRSYEINPSVPTLNWALARLLAKGRQFELASYVLSRIYSATHSDEARQQISSIQEALEAADPNSFDVDQIF